jgi:quinoprotein glucose dehydrogenase
LPTGSAPARRRWFAAAACLSLWLFSGACRGTTAPAIEAYRGWPAYGGGPEQIRYSSLDQINRSTVRQLEIAWTYDSGETGGLQTNPIVIDGVLFTTTPKHRVVALDAVTGRVEWTFGTIEGSGPNRGVVYWSDGDDRRIFAAQHHYLYALDAATGLPVPTFGRDGRIDLREHLGRDPGTVSIALTSPGVVFKDLIIVGGRTSESLPAAPGDIRAYDARTGALRWTFHTIPRPGEFGYETWPADAWSYTGGANNWAGMALDERRGIVFVPTGSAAADFYGANRSGDNLFANSLIALDAATGRRLWHFQAVRHDTWDRDLPAPPSLVTVTHAGRRIDAVAQTSKHGYVFLFDRTSGEPLFPIEYRRTPPSDVEGERSADTQPFPTRPAPFARQMLTEDLLTRRTPEVHRAAVEAFRTFRSGGPFLPVAVGQETVVFPGFDGGAEWGGSAFDPESGVLYVNSNEMAWLAELGLNVTGTGPRATYLRTCATCHRDDFTGAPPQIPSLAGIGGRRTPAELAKIIRQGAGRMPGNPTMPAGTVAALVEYLRTGRSTASGDEPEDRSAAHVKYRFTGFQKFIDAENYPAIAPPWGTLNAIDLNTGEYAWTVPLGEYPELAAQGIRGTGSENYGGPIVTAGGLVFIGATNFDRKFRAFDKATGELVWESLLPFSGNGTPCTYDVDGRQFIVVPAGGGKGRGQFGARAESGGAYVAFALPRDGASR